MVNLATNYFGDTNILVVIGIFWLFNLYYPKYSRSISMGNILVSLINTISTWLAEGNKLGVKEIGSQYPYLLGYLTIPRVPLELVLNHIATGAKCFNLVFKNQMAAGPL